MGANLLDHISCVFEAVILFGSQISSPTVFNNAEESLQDGSHLFSTQHPIAPTSVPLNALAVSIF